MNFLSQFILVILCMLVSVPILANELENEFELEHYPEEKIVLESEEEIVINDNFPSEPQLSPSESKMVFISPYLWEMIGQVYLYDLVEQQEKVIVSNEDLDGQMTPKKIEWITDDYLLLIIGKAYGTVSEGGDLYLFELETNELYEVSRLDDNEEYKDIIIEEEEIILEIAVFDANYLNYELKEQSYSKQELINLLE